MRCIQGVCNNTGMATNTAQSTGRGYEWVRNEGAVWREQDTFDGYRERIRAARVGDLSRVALGGDYDSTCGYCYLGAAHTMDYHAARLLEAARDDREVGG